MIDMKKIATEPESLDSWAPPRCPSKNACINANVLFSFQADNIVVRVEIVEGCEDKLLGTREENKSGYSVFWVFSLR